LPILIEKYRRYALLSTVASPNVRAVSKRWPGGRQPSPLATLCAALLPFALIAISPDATAQAYKCRTPDGRTVIYERPCEASERLLKAAPSETISDEQLAQAREAHRMRQEELERLEREAAAQQEAAPKVAPSPQPKESKRAEGKNRPRQGCGDATREARLTAVQQAALREICAYPLRDAKQFDTCREQILASVDVDRNALLAASCTGDPAAGQRVLATARAETPVVPSVVVPAPLPRPLRPPTPPRDCSRGGCDDKPQPPSANPAKPAGPPTVDFGGKSMNCRMQGNQIVCSQ